MEISLIKEQVETKLNSLGYDLYSINFSNKVLSIVVDRVTPIDMNNIVSLTEIISKYLDEIILEDEPYTLDLSSLGAEKPLKVESIKDYVGSYVNVHLTNPIDGENIYEGLIKEVNNDSFKLEIRVKTRIKTLDILFNNIYKIRLAIKF